MIKSCLKKGNWVDLFENFYSQCQIIFKCDGCGLYDQNGLKNRNSIDICGDFDIQNQVTYSRYQLINIENKTNRKIIQSNCYKQYYGKYKNDYKTGRWDIYQMNYGRMSKKELSGGGFYSQNSLKVRLWAEMIKNCSCICQKIEKGEYKNSIRQGRWSINNKIRTNFIQDVNIYQLIFTISNGGLYLDQEQKKGKWVKLIEDFYEYYIIYDQLINQLGNISHFIR
ncbi:unnamed protein product [Paramecium sonneborni]|uniref:Uncharacterized protein n=1 Tax=Paramecium sonneborni TaxID=65129 RepID=A0A8S1P3K1_9CILI|nr:unnamed protein product [Paramecium sonneborni]